MPPVQSAADVAAEFAVSLAMLVLAFTDRGYRVVPIEVGVLESRRSRNGTRYVDGVHMARSRHYDRAAADLLVYRRVGDEWKLLVDGSDPVYAEIAEWWKGQGADHAAGYDFHDPDHVSIASADGRK